MLKIKRYGVIIRKQFPAVFILVILFYCQRISAEIAVSLEMPELGEGMGRLEALLAENIAPAMAEIDTSVVDLLEKPQLTGAFSTAVGLSSSLPLQGNGMVSSEYSLSLGSYASLYSYTFDTDALEERFSQLSEEDDFEFGVNIHLVNAGFYFPLRKLHPRSSGFVSLAYSDLSGEDIYVRSFFFQTALGHMPFRVKKLNRSFKWSPLYGQIAVSYSSSSLGTEFETGVIEEVFELDPDGNGPLIAQDVSIEIDPLVELGLESRIGTLTAAFSSGITLLDFLHCYIGAGISTAFGRTDIAVDSSDEITILGYLSGLIEEEGRFTISGSVEGSAPVVLLPYFFTGLQVDMSSLFLRIPFQYNPESGISSGISMGVSL